MQSLKKHFIKQVTIHTWQSMKDRYLKHLQHRPPPRVYEPITFKLSGGYCTDTKVFEEYC